MGAVMVSILSMDPKVEKIPRFLFIHIWRKHRRLYFMTSRGGSKNTASTEKVVFMVTVVFSMTFSMAGNINVLLLLCITD